MPASEVLPMVIRTVAHLVTLIPEPVFVLDTTGTICAASQAAGELAGIEGEALIGRSLVDMLPPGDRDSLAQALAALAQTDRQTVGGNRPISWRAGQLIVERLTAPEPAVVLVVARFVSTTDALEPEPREPHTQKMLAVQRGQEHLGRLLGLLGPTFDLRQLLRDALAIVMEMCGAGAGAIVVLDERGGVALWQAYDEDAALEPALSAALAEGWMIEALRTGAVRRVTAPEAGSPARILPCDEMLLARLQGGDRLIGALLLGDPGAPMEAAQLAAAADIVAAAVLNTLLYARLREADATRERMTNLLVHDIRSPLMATHASIEIAKRAIADLPVHPFVYESLDSGIRSVRSVIDLTNDLLDVKRLQSAVPTLNYRTVELFALCADIRAQMQTLTHERQITLTLRIEPATLSLQADSRLLRRVLVNLIANALRFAPHGSSVTLTATAQVDDVLILVDDEGPGVPTADRDRIFQPFVQGRGEAHRGTGLGLAFCREVVLAHRGRIWVGERPSGGGRFCILLPLSPSGAA